MIKILIVIDLQKDCGIDFNNDFKNHIIQNINANDLIIFTLNTNPAYHQSEIEKYAYRHTNNCNNEYVCTTTTRTDNYFTRKIGQVFKKNIKKSILESYIGYEDVIEVLNSDKDRVYTIGIYGPELKDIYNLDNPDIKNIKHDIKAVEKNSKFFIKLNRNENCFLKSYSAFNYQYNVLFDENEQYDKYTLGNLDIDKKYSTGLWEFLVNYNKMNNPLIITVCGAKKTYTEIYTIIFGIVYFNKFYNTSTTSTESKGINVQFIYNINNENNEKVKTEYIKQETIKHYKDIFTSLIKDCFTRQVQKELQIIFTIRYCDEDFEYDFQEYVKNKPDDKIINSYKYNKYKQKYLNISNKY